MALFGDLGKALGLDNVDTGDLLAVAGTAAGFYYGGPGGAALGSGIGSLAGGKSVNDALSNAALAYGVTNFVSPNMMSQAAQDRAGFFGRTGMQESLYGVPTTGSGMGISMADQGVPTGDPGVGSGAATDSGGGLFSDFFDDFGVKEGLIGIGALGALSTLKPEEEEEIERRPQPVGEAFGTVEGPFSGRTYELDTPADVAAYADEVRQYQDSNFDYTRPPVFLAEGGSAAGEVTGPGTGTSDSVPARLSDGEFVLTAKAVRGAGGGDRDIGAARMYDMMSELEAQA